MSRPRWLSTVAWWLLPALYCTLLASCAGERSPVAAGSAWQPFVVNGFVLAKTYQPPHAEPATVAGQVVVRQVPARWVMVVVTPYGALTFPTGPGVYFAFAEHDLVLVRGTVSADGRQCRVDGIARQGSLAPPPTGMGLLV